MSDAQLEILAGRAGLAVDWIDANGRAQKVSPAVLRSVLTGLGHPLAAPRKSMPACYSCRKINKTIACPR